MEQVKRNHRNRNHTTCIVSNSSIQQ
jgi:hypothetical protein